MSVSDRIRSTVKVSGTYGASIRRGLVKASQMSRSLIERESDKTCQFVRRNYSLARIAEMQATAFRELLA